MRIENPVETVLGAIVIAVAVGFAGFAAQGSFNAAAPQSTAYTASFSSIGSIAPGTDVRIAGVKVGAVSSVELDPETFRATVTMAINSGVDLPEDTLVAIDADGLLGGQYVALAPGASFDLLEPGDAIENTQPAISLNALIAQVLASTSSKDSN